MSGNAPSPEATARLATATTGVLADLADHVDSYSLFEVYALRALCLEAGLHEHASALLAVVLRKVAGEPATGPRPSQGHQKHTVFPAN